MSSTLASGPCRADAPRLDQEQVLKLKQAIDPEWELVDKGKAIERLFQLADFHETQAFFNALAWIAHRQDHHPDISLGYRTCRVRYSTHSAGGLTVNDFICAARIDALFA